MLTTQIYFLDIMLKGLPIETISAAMSGLKPDEPYIKKGSPSIYVWDVMFMEQSSEPSPKYTLFRKIILFYLGHLNQLQATGLNPIDATIWIHCTSNQKDIGFMLKGNDLKWFKKAKLGLVFVAYPDSIAYQRRMYKKWHSNPNHIRSMEILNAYFVKHPLT